MILDLTNLSRGGHTNTEISVQNKKYDSRESCFLFCYVLTPSNLVGAAASI